MNTSALKAFAPAVRRQLMEAVTRKLDFVLSAQTPDYLTTCATQVAALRGLAEADRSGLIERVAYTWFNRLAALRYLDARGWHPFRARVLTPVSPEETQPELLKLTRVGSLPEELRRHTDAARLNDLLDGRLPSSDPQGEVYRHLMLAACRFYYTLLPDLFEKLDDETELLLPDDLLTEHSVAHGFRTEITDEDCAEVEVLGWLYQFYIVEKKGAVMARKSAVPTADIPAVTQLFTPHWIVRYLVENSLGRLWLLNRPGSRLREQMPYYIEGEAETEFIQISRPEEIRLLDPAVGSGHMLTYAFDLLYAIYEEEGYAPSEIAGLILTHNLYGVDIDQRAAQLASMALAFKAREKSRRFFQHDQMVRPHIIALQDVRFEEGELREYVRAFNLGDLFDRPVLELLHQFKDATTFGSLIQPCLDEEGIASIHRAVEDKDPGSQLFLRETHLKVLRVLEQAKYLTGRYHVVVANPPYMGGVLNGLFANFIQKAFPDSTNDLSAAFIPRCLGLTVSRGFSALVTMHSWMFVSTLETLRRRILTEQQIVNLVHHGIGAFPSLNSKVVQTAAFVLKQGRPHRPPVFLDIREVPPARKEAASRLKELVYDRLTQEQIRGLPIATMAYWLTPRKATIFAEGSALSLVSKPRAGISTGENERFVRYWFEPSLGRIAFSAASRQRDIPFYPHNKAGGYRKWYGHASFVLRYDERALSEMASCPGFRHDNSGFYFEAAVSWGKVTSAMFSARYYPPGFTFDGAGLAIFPEEPFPFLGLLNSVVFRDMIAALSQTLNFTVGDIGRFPLEKLTASHGEPGRLAYEIARADWDSFETSWDFTGLSWLRSGLKGETLAESWSNWKAQCDDAIRLMQELETKNNRLFIEAYGLQDELSPEVPEDKITLARADARKDVAAFISYAVGCMMGRYSLDRPGLVLADAGDTLANYLAKVGKPLDEVAFAPDADGIIPVLDGDWFEDDIVARIREFLRATFGEATLRENLRFIEESLGKDLRKYLLGDFYKDHLQTYKKRPIYWLVQSPRKGFSVLVYLHRYTRDTMNLVLNRYLRPYQERLRSRLAQLAHVLASDAVNARDETAARKEADKLTKTLRECEEWERQTLLPLAQARIELDLDDGVKVNYLKLGEALAPIPKLAAAEE